MWGAVYDRTLVFAQNNRAAVPLAGLEQPRIEPEICFKLKSTPPRTKNPAALLEAIEWVAHSVEIVQCHHPEWKMALADCIADNALHGRLIVGTPVEIHRISGLAAALPFLKVDAAQRRAPSSTRAPAPTSSTARCFRWRSWWRSSRSRRNRRRCAAGEIVSTGTLTDAHPVRAGETWSTDLHGFALRGLTLNFEFKTMKRPLEGITVVALEQVIAGPFCTRQLAELGARVIKIERPGGGDAARGYDRTVLGQSSHFVWVNRSKESLSLDVKHPRGEAGPGKTAAEGGRLRAEPRAGRGRTARPGRGRVARAAIPGSSGAASPATAPAAPMPTRKPTTCWCNARRACCR